MEKVGSILYIPNIIVRFRPISFLGEKPKLDSPAVASVFGPSAPRAAPRARISVDKITVLQRIFYIEYHGPK